MTDLLRLAIGQLDFKVGDVRGNAALMAQAALDARDRLRAHAIVFPELALTGYPPEDLLLRPQLRRQVESALADVSATAPDIDIIVGHPRWDEARLYNAASVLRDGGIHATYDKRLLPNYGVFDEERYFAPGSAPVVVEIAGRKVGILICEDMWFPEPARDSCAAGARALVVLNASPYHMQKGQVRVEVARERARETGCPLVYANLVGGQDELVFDGDSFVMDASGQVTQRCPPFSAGVHLVTFRDGVPVAVPSPPPKTAEEEVYHALMLGLYDYVSKNGFPGVVIGLSGGIDSALVLCLAVDALGAGRVEAVMMPSRHTSQLSLELARAQAQAMGVRYREIAIEPVVEAFSAVLPAVSVPEMRWATAPRDVSLENIQARARGTLLMALSNRSGRMVLATGNKSEMAVGYATLYGDMAGGFAVIKDVFKTWVYRLVRYRNGLAPVIPEGVLTRPPTAELAADQLDTDSLPPYDVLDPILERYIERDESPETIVAAGYDTAMVRRVVSMVDRNEYKRRQAAPGVRITQRAFGRDRRYPITSGYREG